MGKLIFQKLDIDKAPVGEPIEVQFNPTEYAFEKTAGFAEVAFPGLDSPILQFVRGQSEKLTLELLFDGTSSPGVGGAFGAIGAGIGGGGGEDPPTVTERVDAFYRMVKVQGENHSPPLVRVSWGSAFPGATTSESDRPSPDFDAVVETVNRRYTLFDPEGAPLRCIVGLTLKEYRTLDEQLTAINFQTADHTRTHTIREGETLPQIAWNAYKDPARWRVIAEANSLSDPTELVPGQALELPPVV